MAHSPEFKLGYSCGHADAKLEQLKKEERSTIWPCGRFEVYDSEDISAERLNGFHIFAEARECQSAFPDSIILDRQSKFVDGMKAIYNIDEEFEN